MDGGLRTAGIPGIHRRDATGPETGRKHVFAVMKTQALSGRFGGEGVHLIVYFD
ncbi:hypothetical protein [Streptomyces sp. NPDC003077]|uniref:hypothetical protein n=1 Tax=Streptomyces sp. NPDC003077 TaxID=3154443 RepID=UPI0033A93EA0